MKRQVINLCGRGESEPHKSAILVRAEGESNNQNLKQGDRAKLFFPFDSSRRASHFIVFVCQIGLNIAKLCPCQAPKF